MPGPRRAPDFKHAWGGTTMLVENLLTPTILFFALGLVAAVARSDLTIPDGAAKVMSIYLLFAIGFKGGVSVADSGLTGGLVASLVAGIALSFVLPFIAWGLLRIMTRHRNICDRKQPAGG